MAVTVLEVRNWGSPWRKIIVFEHEEDLGVFRGKLIEAVKAAGMKRFKEGRINPLCFDDIWADIEKDFSNCRYQVLDMQELLNLPSERTKIVDPPNMEKS